MSYPDVITPHRYGRTRFLVRESLRLLRSELHYIRILRASPHLLDREEADGRLDAAWHEHNRIRCTLRWLRTVRVEKGSAWSPAAAARRCRL